MPRVLFHRRFRVRHLVAGLFATALVSAGVLCVAPAPAAAQGTLTAPAGQARVTAPGGMGGRAAMRHRHRYMHRMKRRHR